MECLYKTGAAKAAGGYAPPVRTNTRSVSRGFNVMGTDWPSITNPCQTFEATIGVDESDKSAWSLASNQSPLTHTSGA